MIPILKRLYLLILISLALMLPVKITTGAPTLYGKVLLKRPSGTVPLNEAKVEIISPNSKKVLYKTYTDSNGLFAFYSIPHSSNEIQVLLGTKILKQQVGDLC